MAQVIADTTLKRGVDKNLSREIAAYLLSERRVSDLSSLTRDIQDMWANAGHVEVLASSTYPLSGEIKLHIEKIIKDVYPDAKEIVVTEVHDPAIIGGVRLNLANQQLDLSIKAKLNKFKQLTLTGKD
jgi:F0F1-type ATP synthase delta subunit